MNLKEYMARDETDPGQSWRVSLGEALNLLYEAMVVIANMEERNKKLEDLM